MSQENQSLESDSDIFFGKLTLNEIKKRFNVVNQRRAPAILRSPDEPIFEEDYIKIIETKSEPDLTSAPDMLACDLSTDLIDLCNDVEDAEKFTTPLKPTKHKEVFSTPTNEVQHETPNSKTPTFKTPVFKTPGNPLSCKKVGSATKSGYPKNKAYDHVKSPIGFYIKNSATVPLIQNVKPTKPLAGASSIPVPVKAAKSLKSDKENIKLPKLAYISSKNTVVSSKSESSLPIQYAKKLMSTLPRPMVIRHASRENVTSTKGQHQDNSFADLTLHQAETSVCTQKFAFS